MARRSPARGTQRSHTLGTAGGPALPKRRELVAGFSWYVESPSRIQNQISLWPADAREAGTGLRLRIGRFEIADAAGLDRDDARTATARATAGVDSHALRLRELQEVLRGGLPPNILSRPAECDVQFRHHRRLARRRGGGLFLHGRGTESFEVNILVRHAPRLQAVGDALHERAIAAEEILEVARRQQFL